MSSAWVTRLECPKGVKDEVKLARRAKRVAEGHQLEIGAQRAPRFLVLYILLMYCEMLTILMKTTAVKFLLMRRTIAMMMH